MVMEMEMAMVMVMVMVTAKSKAKWPVCGRSGGVKTQNLLSFNAAATATHGLKLHLKKNRCRLMM